LRTAASASQPPTAWTTIEPAKSWKPAPKVGSKKAWMP
jgi:hypothetical protein